MSELVFEVEFVGKTRTAQVYRQHKCDSWVIKVFQGHEVITTDYFLTRNQAEIEAQRSIDAA